MTTLKNRILFLLAVSLAVGVLFLADMPSKAEAGTTYIPHFVTSTTVVYGKNVARDSIIPTAVTGSTKHLTHRGHGAFGARIWCIQATANDSMRVALEGDVYVDGTQRKRWMVNNDTLVVFLPVTKIACDSAVKKGANYPQLHFEVYIGVVGDIDDLLK